MVIRLGSAAARVWAAASGGGPQQRLGPGQEDLPGLGEPAALRGAVEEPGAQLLLQAADLPAQRRLIDVEDLGGTAEVQVLGDDGEVPHQPQIEVRRRLRRVGHTRMVSASIHRSDPRMHSELG